MYFCMMKVRFESNSVGATIYFISFRSEQMVMPWPRLVFSPGLTIQRFFSAFIALYSCKNWKNLKSLTPFFTWKVSGSTSNGSLPFSV